jgi:RNA polymerase sigma factor (sigma-70 family)
VGYRSVSLRDETDASVIAESLRRPQAFAAIFDRHYDAVHRYLARRAGTDRADDLAAATFATAFERRGTFRDHLEARPWLFGIATNLLRNEWRTEQRALHAVDELAVHAGRAATESPAEPLPLAELLAGLDPDQRDVLLLHAWEGLNYREIALALDVPVGTVRSRLSRGRARLREALARQQPADREKTG